MASYYSVFFHPASLSLIFFFVCLFFVFWPQESKTSTNRELFCLIHYYIPQQVRNLPVSAGDTGGTGLIPGMGRPPGGGHGNPLQYSCLENPVDRGAWWATVCGVTKNQSQLSMHAAAPEYVLTDYTIWKTTIII